MAASLLIISLTRCITCKNQTKTNDFFKVTEDERKRGNKGGGKAELERQISCQWARVQSNILVSASMLPLAGYGITVVPVTLRWNDTNVED